MKLTIVHQFFVGIYCNEFYTKRGKKCRNTSYVAFTPLRKNSFKCADFHNCSVALREDIILNVIGINHEGCKMCVKIHLRP
jgi:hypothetical protein